jgi:hypothetical protein
MVVLQTRCEGTNQHAGFDRADRLAGDRSEIDTYIVTTVRGIGSRVNRFTYPPAAAVEIRNVAADVTATAPSPAYHDPSGSCYAIANSVYGEPCCPTSCE